MNHILILVTWIIIVMFSWCCANDNISDYQQFAPIIRLRHGGLVRGLIQHDPNKNRTLYLYQGIRYGRAKRFAKPHSVKGWQGVYDAIRYRDACPQPKLTKTVYEILKQTDKMSEDCLYLNVWQPSDNVVDNNQTLKPVMVWIHGGYFAYGTIFSESYDGRYLASAGDLIVVSVAYRLGPFGFLYAGTANETNGNYGLFDQILALEWVRDNIHHFGGDPNRVTLFGESAGAMAVGALVLSPAAENLFHRVILQSGAPNSYFGSDYPYTALAKTKLLATDLGCSVWASIEESVACLRNQSVLNIVRLTEKFRSWFQLFQPVVGTTSKEGVLPMSPSQALANGSFYRHLKGILFGVTRDEGSSFLVQVVPMLQHSTNFISQTAIRLLSQLLGDFVLACPTVLFGEAIAEKSLAFLGNQKRQYYAYELSYIDKQIGKLTNCTNWMGVCHGQDLFYLFMVPSPRFRMFFNVSATARQLSTDMIASWTEFANYGVITHLFNSGNKLNNGSSTKQFKSIPWTGAFEHKWTQWSGVNFLSLDPRSYQMLNKVFRFSCDVVWRWLFG